MSEVEKILLGTVILLLAKLHQILHTREDYHEIASKALDAGYRELDRYYREAAK